MKIISSSVLIIFTLLFSACGNSEAGSDSPEGDWSSSSEANAEGGQESGNGEVVNFRELQSLLPDRMAGLERTDFSGQTTGAMGFSISVAEAIFEDGDARLEVVITDTGGLVSIATGIASWTTLEIDRETQDGYERTTTINGFKAFEKYNRRNRRGELSLFVDDRFVVVIKGRNIEEDAFHEAVQEMDLNELANL